MAAPSWWPTLTVEFQWGYGLADSWSDTFTDESDRVRSISIRRGRDDELQQTQTGTATIVLDNRDGALDPNTNTDVRPNVRVKISVDVAAGSNYPAQSFPLFGGFIDVVTPTWESSWGETVTIECVDPLALLALYPYSASRGSEPVDARLDALFAEIAPSYTPGGGYYDGGYGPPQTMPAKTYDRVPALDVLNEIALAEDGPVHVRGSGSVYVYQRYSLGGTGSIKLTDAPTFFTDWEYESVEIDYSMTYVYNDVTVTDDAAHDWSVTSSGSVAKYGARKLDLSIPVDDTAEVVRRAEWVANAYGEPRFRVRSVSVRPSVLGDNDAWFALLSAAQVLVGGVEVIGSRPGGAFAQECHVQGVSHDIDATGDWVITYSTSPKTVVPGTYDHANYDEDRYA